MITPVHLDTLEIYPEEKYQFPDGEGDVIDGSRRVRYYNEWRWRVQAEGNNQIVLASTESFATVVGAELNAMRYLTVVEVIGPNTYKVAARV